MRLDIFTTRSVHLNSFVKIVVKTCIEGGHPSWLKKNSSKHNFFACDARLLPLQWNLNVRLLVIYLNKLTVPGGVLSSILQWVRNQGPGRTHPIGEQPKPIIYNSVTDLSSKLFFGNVCQHCIKVSFAYSSLSDFLYYLYSVLLNLRPESSLNLF